MYTDEEKMCLAREIQQREEMSALNAAKRVGKEEGREEGRLEGKLEGREEGKLEATKALIKKLLEFRESLDKISAITGLTHEEIELIAKE